MIYRFVVLSYDVDEFVREITIDSESTFLELRDAICDAVGYDKGVLSSFYITDDDWEPTSQIVDDDLEPDSDASTDIEMMSRSVLRDHNFDQGQKLVFVFDIMTERYFNIELKELIPGKSQKTAKCTYSKGKAPKQSEELNMDFSDIAVKNPKQTKGGEITDLGDDFFGEGVDEDELSEGDYNISDDFPGEDYQ